MTLSFRILCCCLLSVPAIGQDIGRQLEALDSAFARGDYQEAGSLSEKIYPNRHLIIGDSTAVDFLSTSGSVQYHLAQYKKAGDYFLEAAQEAQKKLGDDNYRYPLALFNLAACYKEEGRYAEAEPLFLQSLPPLAGVFGQSSIEYTRCFYTLGSMYIDMGKFDEAESMCTAAVHFYKTILGAESDDYLGALGAMGVIYQGQGKYEKAEEIYLFLKKYQESLPAPDSSALQTLQNNLGDLYRHMGEYDKAEPVLEKAIAMANGKPAAAVSLNNLALVQKALGKYAEAESSYKKALQLYISRGQTHHPDYTNPLNNLGELYRTMGRLQDAVYAFEEVIEIRKELLGKLHPNYANALNNLALVEFATGHYDEAEKHLLECRDIYHQTLGEKDKYYANCLNNLASVYKAKGSLDQAEINYRECLRIFRATYGETSDKYGIYLGGLAGTCRMQKKYDEAIRLTLQALEILRNKLGTSHYDYIETVYNLAETYREAGQDNLAEKYYLEAMKGFLLLIQKYFPYLSEKDKTLFYYNVSGAFETFQSFAIDQLKKDPKGDHADLISRIYDNQIAIKSLLLRESEKMREAVAASRDTAIRQDYRQWLLMRETIVQYYRLSEEDRSVKGINLPQLEVNANNLEQKITIALKLSGNGQTDLKSWKDIRAALEPGEFAVEILRTSYYSKGEWTDTVYYSALILGPNSVFPQWVMIPNGSQLESRNISQYRIAMKGRQEDGQSYNVFWGPVKKYLEPATRVYFSADGVYQQINLYTLRNPVSKKYLIDEMNISLVTNTRDLLAKKDAGRSQKAAIFSYPDYGSSPLKTNAVSRWTGFPELDELPGTKAETDTVKRILESSGWTVTEKIRGSATEKALKDIQQPGILHIATHGFFLKDVRDTVTDVYGIKADIAKQNPLLRSGLILAGAAAVAREPEKFTAEDDGVLTAYEAAGLDLNNTGLVVLSACETGLGEILNGQGVYGLQRAFLLAGARSVIMSLWKVNDNSTKELMILFYRNWLKDPGAGKQKALRLAQLELREKYPHPFYWGPFIMVGD